MPKLNTLYWRDIPAQVIAKERRENAKLVLTERFAEAIDKAAMRAGMAGTDAYLEQWRQESVKCGNDLQAAVDAAAARLEQDYDDARLAELVRSGGVEAEEQGQNSFLVQESRARIKSRPSWRELLTAVLTA